MTLHNVAELQDKLVVITGGTSGIGLALAHALSERKARIVVVARERARIDQVLTEFGGPSKRFGAFTCDIGSGDDVVKVGAAIVAGYGCPDILVNNAGYATYHTFEQHEVQELDRLISVNFTGAVRMTHAFLHGMIERGTGSIINVASIAGALTLTPNALYCGAKHGMVAWSKCLAIEVRRFNIHVGIVYPGRVETNFFNHESFRGRLHRKETELVVPMEAVIKAILDMIVHRRETSFVPSYLAAVAWAANAGGPLARLALDRLLLSRIEDIYRAKKDSS